MKKVIVYLIILISVSTIAYAGGKPLRPGKNTMGYAVLTEVEGQCSADFADYEGASIGGEGECSFKAVINGNKLIATCICPEDNSSDGIFQNAEGGYIPLCRIQMESIEYLADGTGFIHTVSNDANGVVQVIMVCMADIEE